MSDTIELPLERQLQLITARLHNAEILIHTLLQLTVTHDGENLQRAGSDHFMASKSLGAFKSSLFKDSDSLTTESGGGTKEELSGGILQP